MTEKRARRIVRGWKGVTDVTGLGRTQLQDKIAKGTFPPPMKLSDRAIGWFEDVIAEWQDHLVVGQRKAHPND